MIPVISFTSSPEHYTADACVVWCFDDRFYKLLKVFGKQEGFHHIDLVKVAGGVRALAGDMASDKEFVLGQVVASVRLHGTKRVVLMVHRDCGGYGGSKNFADLHSERSALEQDLRAARNLVKSTLPEVAVNAYFADFDGLYEVD